jgi:hypothetical protein
MSTSRSYAISIKVTLTNTVQTTHILTTLRAAICSALLQHCRRAGLCGLWRGAHDGRRRGAGGRGDGGSARRPLWPQRRGSRAAAAVLGIPGDRDTFAMVWLVWLQRRQHPRHRGQGPRRRQGHGEYKLSSLHVYVVCNCVGYREKNTAVLDAKYREFDTAIDTASDPRCSRGSLP